MFLFKEKRKSYEKMQDLICTKTLNKMYRSHALKSRKLGSLCYLSHHCIAQLEVETQYAHIY